jgi:hypothetical protein
MRSALLLLLVALPAFAQPDEALQRAKSKLVEAQVAVDEAIVAQQHRPAPAPDETAERLETVEADIEELVRVQEVLVKHHTQDRLAWSADYRIAMNNLVFDRSTGDRVYPNIWNHRLRLGLEGERGPLRLHARLSVYKNFGEGYEGPVGFDSRSTRYPRDTALRIERLYLDWFVHKRVAITVGRVASPGGPPAELKENTPRQATWGLQMVEAEFETLLVTFDLSDTLPDTTLRFFYSPFFHHARLDPNNDESLFADNGIETTQIWGFLAESKIAGLGDNTLIQLGFVHVPAFRPERMPLPTPNGPLMPSALPDSLGQYFMINTLLEIKGLAKVLDLFVAGSATLYAPDGAIEYDLGGQTMALGLATNGEDEHLAWMLFGGGRYQLPFGEERAPKVGLEVNYGSKHHSSWGSPSETLINKLATRGLAAEAYWIQPILPGDLFARVGLIHQSRTWSGSFVGPAQPAEANLTNLYFLMNATF